MGLLDERSDAGHVRRGHRRARYSGGAATRTGQGREDANTGSGNVGFEPAITVAWTAGGEAREASETWVRDGGVGQRNRATGTLRRVRADEVLRIRGVTRTRAGRRVKTAANSEERNGNDILKTRVWIGCNLTFKRWIAAIGVEHRRCGRIKTLCADRPPDARACATSSDDELARNPAWITGIVCVTASKRHRAVRVSWYWCS